MGRIIIRGGVWKNTEDEVLKAAVMKYGKNQWSRVSSLLTRKSAKQCKARWYEWLDPSIKKTEWTRDEEEKLLHMAKLMPNQWRTIAPMVGRTAYQCLDHYNTLLDRAQGEDELTGSDDPRKLRPGEIDPAPEAKPCRPDPVDMDDDEKEMLSEARARLANTKGKKAKRLARERQLDESRRMAVLQKRRELKMAGLPLPRLNKRVRKKTDIDYENEIPFQRQAAPGFYDTASEEEIKRVDAGPEGANRWLDSARKRELEEAKQRKEDKKRQKVMQDENLPQYIHEVNKRSLVENIRKRTDLSLPEPQVTDSELHQISKMGSMVGIDGQTPMRGGGGRGTPMAATPMSMSGTPIIPGTPMTGTPMVGSTPVLGGGSTPAIGGQTPLQQAVAMVKSISTPTSNTVVARKASRKRPVSSAVSNLLESLPKPTNEFEVAIPEDRKEDDETAPKVLDAQEASKIKKTEEWAGDEIQAALIATLSKTVQRSLPRPPPARTLTTVSCRDDDDENIEKARVEVATEMSKVVRYEAKAAPVEGALNLGLPREVFSAEEMTEASDLIAVEEADFVAHHGTVKPQDYRRVWDLIHNEMQVTEVGRVHRASLSQTKLIHALKWQHTVCRALNAIKALEEETARCEAAQAKVEVMCKGYTMRASALTQRLTEAREKIRNSVVDAKAFTALLEHESEVITERKMSLRREVEVVRSRHAALQLEHKKLLEERDSLKASVAA